jgi:hypothetical protein
MHLFGDHRFQFGASLVRLTIISRYQGTVLVISILASPASVGANLVFALALSLGEYKIRPYILRPLAGKSWERGYSSHPPLFLPVIPAQAGIHEAAGKPWKAGFLLTQE